MVPSLLASSRSGSCGAERATAARGRRLTGAGIRARRSGQERAGSRVGRLQMTAVHREGGGTPGAPALRSPGPGALKKTEARARVGRVRGLNQLT